ncbi:enterotoxin A family protein [Yersinia enterocolitica]|uniref:enterotoxin A family protein n=1 Tax=Yersinia enterocolitica TaxID=630 RepID=UPI003AB8C6C2
MKKITNIFFCFIKIMVMGVFISSSVYANDYFRADSRPPDEIKRAGGLLPKGQNEAYERGTPVNINLYDHARGEVTGNTRYNDGYVSTTNTLNQAHIIGQNMFGGLNEYYIYVIAAAPNMFDVNGVLGRYSPHPYEHEFAALGGIPWSQVIGWYRVSFGAMQGSMTRNRNYRNDLFRGLSVAPNEDGYRLAGFPDGFQAWRELPWSEHAPEQCGLNRKKRSTDPCEAITNEMSKEDLNGFKHFLKRKEGLLTLMNIDDYF